ncbi:Panacea domain-containing protein [Fluviispira multicolorata]|uniref:Panacea domain-containing protein n=1 Tax=Fluviispira multicolorata TaxID=2654512 RepID=UPI0013758D5C|nr:type II toxin-antitoxin system antitoxin SocA domain-containing protein [Fluviispira multicolorata]
MLKFQKLAYYCFGAALAYDLDNEVNGIEFEAWKYGPVNRKVYDLFKNPNDPYYKIDSTHHVFNDGNEKSKIFSKQLIELISAIVDIYGRLSPRSLVNETHEEKIEDQDNPWKKTYHSEKEHNLIDNMLIKHFFKKKFNNEEQKTFLPLGLFDYNSFLLDNIPIVAFKDIFEVAHYLNQEINMLKL